VNVIHLLLKIVMVRQIVLKLPNIKFRENVFSSSVVFFWGGGRIDRRDGDANGPTKISFLICKCHIIALHASCKVTSETVKEPSYGKLAYRISSLLLSR
jgi:hypothetical protein